MIEQKDIEGSWELVAWEIHYGGTEPALPFGPAPFGLLVYSGDGYMSAQLSVAEREPLGGASVRKLSDHQRQALLEGFFAYCGRYTVESDRVVHHVTQSLNPDFIGSQQTRMASLEGNVLTLSGNESDQSGNTRKHILIWKRATRSDS